MSEGFRSDLDYFFKPRTIAVIGASPKHGINRAIFSNFLKSGYKGKVFPVNPKYEEFEIDGKKFKVYKSVKDIPEEVDLAVISVRAQFVPAIAEECGQKGVKAVVVISGGFKEIGPQGAERERKLREVAKKYGFRVIGPNCVGVLDTSTGVDTFFLPHERMARPKPGGVAFISQSGAFAGAIRDAAAMSGIGLEKVISHGNKVDVNEADLLDYLREEPSIKVIAIYLEGLEPGEGPRFMEALKRTSLEKPVIIVKAGKTKRGTAAVSSHTGSLAGSYEVYSAAIRQAGGIEVRDFQEMFDTIKYLLTQPLPQGNRLLIVTNGGGFGVMSADAAELEGFEVPELSEELQKKMREVGNYPETVSTHNPVDVIGDTDAMRYKVALDVALPSDEVDAALVNLLMQVPNLGEEVVDYVAEMKKYNKPVIVAYIPGVFANKVVARLNQMGVPTYETPERALRALRNALNYANWLKRVKAKEYARN